MSTAMTTAPNNQELIAAVGNAKLGLGKRIESIGELLKANKGKMLAALPRHITPDRMIRVAMNCIAKNPALLDCTPQSLFACITEAATYGWELGGILGHAYLVPFKQTCTLIPGYKGLIDLCRRSGQISTIALESVYASDQFSYSLGLSPDIKHVPSDHPDRTRQPIVYTYCVIRLKDGGHQLSVWSTAQVNAHKEQYSKGWAWAENGRPPSGGKKDSPWHTAWPTMAKKTVVRDMIARGLVPMSPEFRNMADRVQQEDSLAFSGDDLFEAPHVEVLEPVVAAIEETHDRPATTEEPCLDTIDQFRADLDDCTSADLVDTCQNSWLPRCPNEPTRTVVLAECQQKRQTFSKGKAKQKELV
jgi:recombination protein RecT